jgi:TadE-like protein
VASTTILVPAALLLVFFVLQTGLWFYGRTLATYAAQHGLDAARLESACGTSDPVGEAAGEDVAQQAFDSFGNAVALDGVEVDCGAEFVTIDIDAEAPSILPRWSTVPLHVNLEAPVERPDQ